MPDEKKQAPKKVDVKDLEAKDVERIKGAASNRCTGAEASVGVKIVQSEVTQ